MERSHITGNGYGSSHAWRCAGTMSRATRYSCADCGATFLHRYPAMPDIFQAIYEAGAPNECPSPVTVAGKVSP